MRQGGWTALLLALLPTACGSPSADTATTAAPPAATATADPDVEPPPEWLGLSLDYSPRHSVGMRRLDVVTVNGGADDLHVDRVALRSDHFEHLPPDEKTSIVRAGSTVNVKAHFGPVVNCDATGPLEASVLMVARIGDDPAAHTWETAVDPGTLEEIHISECRARAVDEAVSLRFADEWTDDGAVLTTDLVLERRGGDEPVTLESVRGLTLLAMRPLPDTAGPVAVLEPGEATRTTLVEISVWRCDEHVVSQSPDGFTFRAVLRVGDGDPHEVVMVPQGALMERLVDLVDACARSRRSDPLR